MPKDLLVRVGEVLFGLDHWRSGLRDVLELNPRTLPRWLSREAAPPRGIYEALLALVQERIGDANDVAEELVREIERLRRSTPKCGSEIFLSRRM